MSRSLLAVCCGVGVLAACSPAPAADPAADDAHTDIARVLDVKASFGPEFQVTSIAPTGIDPRLLAPQALPAGVMFDPADCAKAVTGLSVPPGLKGNMAATTAEGDGNRFITIAVETSQALQLPNPGDSCRRVAFAGGGVRGLVEVAESPTIADAKTLATHRVVQTVVDGKPASGEIYNYVASFDTFTVIVTANPLVQPDKPVVPVDTQRARDLLTAAVAAVRGG